MCPRILWHSSHRSWVLIPLPSDLGQASCRILEDRRTVEVAPYYLWGCVTTCKAMFVYLVFWDMYTRSLRPTREMPGFPEATRLRHLMDRPHGTRERKLRNPGDPCQPALPWTHWTSDPSSSQLWGLPSHCQGDENKESPPDSAHSADLRST